MLVVTIHDVAPPHLAAIARLRDALHRWGVGAVTLLAVPDFHGAAPLAADPATARWLRRAADAGDEVALHGWQHRQHGQIPGWGDRLRAALLTAGEGEMLSLDPAAARRRLGEGRAGLEQLLGRRVAGFVAPAWLEPRGLGGLLADAGFAWHETGLLLERLAGPGAPGAGRVRHRAPVLGFATRSPWRERAAIAWASGLAPLASAAARAGGIARVALHPADVTSERVMACAGRLLRALAARHPSLTTAAALGA